jgi:hypothetical protein
VLEASIASCVWLPIFCALTVLCVPGNGWTISWGLSGKNHIQFKTLLCQNRCSQCALSRRTAREHSLNYWQIGLSSTSPITDIPYQNSVRFTWTHFPESPINSWIHLQHCVRHRFSAAVLLYLSSATHSPQDFLQTVLVLRKGYRVSARIWNFEGLKNTSERRWQR